MLVVILTKLFTLIQWQVALGRVSVLVLGVTSGITHVLYKQCWEV